MKRALDVGPSPRKWAEKNVEIMIKLHRVAFTVTEEQYQFLRDLRKAKIPTTVFMRSLLQQHIQGYANGNKNGPLRPETTVVLKNQQQRMVPLLRAEQKRTIELAGAALGAELKSVLQSLKMEDTGSTD